MEQDVTHIQDDGSGQKTLLHTPDLKLFRNVQFVYELALAKLELVHFGACFKTSEDFRAFHLLECNPDLEKLIRKRSAYFQTVNGHHTDYDYINQKNQTRSVNQYLTHWIYPYKGKFHPQMIRALLNIIQIKPGELLLDPFIGSGTTALEAQLLGIDTIGFDVSPLCVLQSKVKTESMYHYSNIQNTITTRLHNLDTPLFSTESGQLFRDDVPQPVNNFFRLAQLISISDQKRRRRNYLKSLEKNINLMLSSVKDHRDVFNELEISAGKIDIRLADSRKLPLANESIDGIITSPPYSIALDYVQNDAHSLEMMGFDIQKIREEFIGVRGKGTKRIRAYNNDMGKSYSEMARVLKPKRYAVIIIGNATYQKNSIPSVDFTIHTMQKQNMELIYNIDKIIFGLYNIMREENILIFQKQG